MKASFEIETQTVWKVCAWCYPVLSLQSKKLKSMADRAGAQVSHGICERCSATMIDGFKKDSSESRGKS